MPLKTHTRRRLRTWANLFCNVRSLPQLGELLGLKPAEMRVLTAPLQYRLFSIPKKQGGHRLLEDPEPELKDILRSLNFYLQCTYFFHRTEAVYGFLIGSSDDRQPRNILTNARQHLGNPWMLNIDFSDFFHCVKYDRVVEIFEQTPFSFPVEVAHWLAHLTTHEHRLPMGAPTSPVLSNFACQSLDYALLGLARQYHWTYTRYADDLTFSGTDSIRDSHINYIRMACCLEGFAFNEQKLRLYAPHEPKYVTGLKVATNTVTLADDYVPGVSAEIGKLRAVLEVKYRSGRHHNDWASHFTKHIKGAIDFVRFVQGDNSPEAIRLQHELHTAQQPDTGYDPVSWLDFGYAEHFF